MPCQWAITRLTRHAFFLDSCIFLFNENTKMQNSTLMPKCKTFCILLFKICLHMRLVRKQIEFSDNSFLWTHIFCFSLPAQGNFLCTCGFFFFFFFYWSQTNLFLLSITSTWNCMTFLTQMNGKDLMGQSSSRSKLMWRLNQTIFFSSFFSYKLTDVTVTSELCIYIIISL
jgi:hypothetical protein